MSTPDRYRWVAAALVLLLLTAPGPAMAQLRILSSPQARAATADVVSQYLVWEGDHSIDGMSVRIPDDWQLVDARLMDESGRFSVELEAEKDPRSGSWRVSRPDLRWPSGQRVRLSMQPFSAGEALIEVVPLARGRDGLEEQGSFRAESVFDVVEPPLEGRNKALRLSGDAVAAPMIETKGTSVDGQESWTLSWWIRSSALDHVVLSTWTGYESDPYPLEAVLDEKGHLALYTGREGSHFAMRSTAPLSDGTWHHVAVVHNADELKMRMHVDGEPQDSLKFDLESSRAGNFSAVRLGYRLQSSRPELSRPLVGDLDDVQLVGRALSTDELGEVQKGAVQRDPERIWHLDFDAPDAGLLSDTGIGSNQLVPSILSVRRAASDLKVRHVPEGILLSFEPGDPEVERYRIDVSADGRYFRNAAVLERPSSGGRRMEWMDRSPSNAVQHYRVTAVYPDGPGDSSPVIKVGSGTDDPISRVHLEGNFPNPFNPTTTIRFEVFEQEHVRVSIWDLSGQMIAQPVDGPHQPGRYEVGFDAGTLPSGTYFVRLESLSGIQTHQMILMK